MSTSNSSTDSAASPLSSSSPRAPKRPRTYAEVAATAAPLAKVTAALARIQDIDVNYQRAMDGRGRETSESNPVEVTFGDGSSATASVSRAIYILGPESRAKKCILFTMMLLLERDTNI